MKSSQSFILGLVLGLVFLIPVGQLVLECPYSFQYPARSYHIKAEEALYDQASIVQDDGDYMRWGWNIKPEYQSSPPIQVSGSMIPIFVKYLTFAGVINYLYRQLATQADSPMSGKEDTE